MTALRVALDLGWADLDGILSVVAGEVRAGGVPDVVVGVLRGGMVPAVVLAHRLGTRAVRGLEVTRTLSDAPDADKTEYPVVGDVAGVGELAGLDVLLVDDVAGSGATAEAATAVLNGQRPARLRRTVVVVNLANWCRTPPDDDPFRYFDHVGTTCSGWVRFPWEGR
ncbi:MAG: purine phosphoribosyltransferase [Pseudonocardia sp.]|nr:purine phosphoribosyltransferase [Pseudonocardia sp.]